MALTLLLIALIAVVIGVGCGVAAYDIRKKQFGEEEDDWHIT